jgi:4-hydroxybenzoate polyprenyltransferase
MRDWLRLIRASGLATILADALAAIVVCAAWAQAIPDIRWAAQRVWGGLDGAAWIIGAGLLCYITGMVWNDIADVERDRVIEPRRPLPSGRIPLAAAVILGIVAPVAALACAAQVRHGFAAAGTVLALSLVYNLGAKQVPWLGSLVMGLTRAAHALMAVLILGPDLFLVTVSGHGGGLVYPALVGCYAAGLTLVSELHHRPGRRIEAATGALAMLGAAVAALTLAVATGWPLHLLAGGGWRPVVAVAGLAALGLACWLFATQVVPVVWAALRDSERAGFGPAVAAGLAGLLLLAAIAAGAAHPLAGVPILLLFPVFRWAARRIRMD